MPHVKQWLIDTWNEWVYNGKDCSRTQKCIFLWVTFGILLLISFILIGVSVSTLEPIEMGLVHNKNTETVDYSRLYVGGRHFLGLGRVFIRFPMENIRLEFTTERGDHISARTYNGLKVDLDISLMYRYPQDREKLYRIFLSFGHAHEETLRNIARSGVRDIASKFDTFDFFSKRTQISLEMLQYLQTKYDFFDFELTDFQLINMEFNTEFADAIEATQVARQDELQAAFEKEQAEVEKQRTVEVATITAEVLTITAEAQAAAHLKQVEEQIAAFKFATTAQITAAKQLKNDLNLTNSGVLSHLWMTALHDQSTSDLLFNLHLPSVIDQSTLYT